MKRVLQVINSMNSGGAEQLLLQQLVLARGIWDSSIVCIDEIGSLESQLRDGGVPVESVGNGRRANVMTIPRLRAIIRQTRPDVLHLHLPRAGIIGRLACWGLDTVPVVYTEHNVFEIYPRIPRMLNAATYRRNDRVVAVSQRVQRSILENVGKRGLRNWPTIIRNAVDAEAVPRAALTREAARHALGIPGDAFVIGNVGNLFPRKGQDVLIRAFARIADTLPAARLAIVGRGDSRDALVALRSSLGLEDRVSFAENIPDAGRYLRAFDVFVLSSLFEGLPVALLEAMAVGLPCVATTVGGIPEVITHEQTGLLVEAGSPDELSTALHRLATAPDDRARFGRAALERVVEKFDMRAMIREIDAVYDLAIRERAAAGERASVSRQQVQVP